MKEKKQIELVVIGGSWGGFQASLSILMGLPADFNIPIILILHRLKNADSELQTLYNKKLGLEVVEIEEKQPIEPGRVYLAPANYHVLIEKEKTFSLDDSELENFSRPSIDVTFDNVAEVYGAHTLGILLSGASNDGSAGLKNISDHNGVAIVQNPEEAEADTMPKSAIKIVPDCLVMKTAAIYDYLLNLQ